MIKVENLTKRYGTTDALRGIGFVVAKQEVLGFLGPNGAGKSTTLKIISGFLSASSGRVEVGGHDVFEKPDAVKRLIGYMPENVPLYAELRVDEYLSYRAALKKVPASRRRAAVDRSIERCRLKEMRRKIIGHLSKGYRQRVGLADALVADPEILILDEPTIGLDPNQIRQVRELIRELGRERTVILSSHILPEVEAVCSRIIIINNGEIVGQGQPEELRKSLEMSGEAVDVEVIDPDLKAADALASIGGVIRVALAQEIGEDRLIFSIEVEDQVAVREAIFDCAVNNGFKLIGLKGSKTTLEDIFVKITTREEIVDEPEQERGGDA